VVTPAAPSPPLAWRGALWIAALTAVMLTSTPALADVQLKWDAPPACPRREEVLRRIRRLAGAAVDAAQVWSAEGVISQRERTFYLKLVVRDGAHVTAREITSESCAALAGAAAVTLLFLLGIEPASKEGLANASNESATTATSPADDRERSRDEAGERAVGRVAPRGADAESHATERSGAASAPSSPRRWDVLVRAPVLALDLGPAPRPSPGAGLGVGLRYRAWSAVLRAQLFARQTLSASDQDSPFGARLQRLNALVTGCRGWRSSRFQLAPCLGLGLEHLTARGFGQDVSARTRRAVWLEPSAELVGHWYASRAVALFASGSVRLELARPVLEVSGRGEVIRLAPVTAEATLGSEWIF